jgi:hypothetical protein
MTRMPRRSTLALWTWAAVTAAACGSTTPSGAPSSSPTSSVIPTAEASATTSPPTLANETPNASASSALACPVAAQTGLLPSDRVVDLAVASTSTDDLVTFVFAAPSTPGPAGPARGTLDAIQPPFSRAGSGQPIDLLGEHAVQVRFTGMTIATDSGEATYRGPQDVKPSLPALREAIQYDASEGVVGWYVGYDGPGCVTLSRNGNDVTVRIAHPEAPAG